MASGLPVIVPDSGGVLSYANPANAWIAPPTGLGFADEVRKLFADEPLRQARVQQGLQTAAEFDWPSVTKRFFALYDELHDRSVGINPRLMIPPVTPVAIPAI